MRTSQGAEVFKIEWPATSDAIAGERSMREETRFGDSHGYWYKAKGEAAYSLLIVHGIGGHGGTYDAFCEPLAERGAHVVSLDLPGHGLARNERGNWRFEQWLEDIDAAARGMKERWGLPVFVLGSSQGSAAAFHSLAYSDAVDGAVAMCIILSEVVPPEGDSLRRFFEIYQSDEGRRKAAEVGDTERIDVATAIDWNKDYADVEADVLKKKQQDPLRAWSYGFASLASYYNYEPPQRAADNTKPVLVSVGEKDPLVSSAYVEACFAEIGGPKTLSVVPDGTHQLMLYHTDEYVPLVDEWVRGQLKPERTASAGTS